MEIDTVDHVLHGPTGETWVVARVLEDKLAWCGWPQGWANLADCTLVKKACPESRLRLLRELAGSSGHHCAEWAAGQIIGEANAWDGEEAPDGGCVAKQRSDTIREGQEKG